MKPEEPKGGPVVEVLYLKSSDDAKFHADWDDTLAQVWDQAYRELREARHPSDVLECQDGSTLMPHLGSTLAQLRDQHICPGRKFQIRGETGGAEREAR